LLGDLVQIGDGKTLLGRPEETEAHVPEALCLSPRDNRAYFWCLFAGLAKFHLGNEEEAVAWVRRSVEINRSFQAHISFWPPHWRGSGGSAKRDPKCRKDLQSFQSSRSPDFAPITDY
jgi:hypothetical protein